MMITFEKIGRSDLGGDEHLTGPRANTPRGSFSTNSPLPYRKFTKTLFDVGTIIFLALFLGSVAFAIMAPIFIVFLFMF